MKLTVLIFVSLYAAVECGLLQGYSLPTPGPSGGGIVSGGGGIIIGGGVSFGAGGFGGSAGLAGDLKPVTKDSCNNGLVRLNNGTCGIQVKRNIYVYDVPAQTLRVRPPPTIPPLKVEHNILFVRLPEDTGALEPIVIPPPEQKNIVYVLNKGTAVDGPKVIHVPAPPKSQPEVYFVNYGDGQNPTLPGGVDLQTALNSAVHQGIGQVIGGGLGDGIVSGGGISGGAVSGGGVSGGIISGGGISSDFGVPGGSSVGGGIISGGSVGEGIISGGSISRGSISGGFISGGSISGGSISGGISSTPSGLYSPP